MTYTEINTITRERGYLYIYTLYINYTCTADKL